MHKIYQKFERFNSIRYGQPVFNNVNKFKKVFMGTRKKRTLAHKTLGLFQFYVTQRHFVCTDFGQIKLMFLHP